MGTPRESAGVVYFIEAQTMGLVKIGCGGDAKRRMAQMQVGSPDKLTLRGVLPTNDPYVLEKRLHRKFAGQKRHGEWFSRPPELERVMDGALDPDVTGLSFHVGSTPPPEALVCVHRIDGDTTKAFVDRLCAVSAALGFPIPE